MVRVVSKPYLSYFATRQVLLCFGLSIVTRHYLGYGLVALLVEVNSVFLHIRQMLLIQGVSKRSLAYRLNSCLNVGTFVAQLEVK